MPAMDERNREHQEATAAQAAGAEPEAAVRPPPPAGRLAYLDNLKALLIAGIIAAHAFMGYADFGSWTYQDVREATLSEPMETIFTILAVTLGGLFLMGLFFLISGLMAQDSLARKGPGAFSRDRLLRLGIPFAIYTLVVWPVLEWAVLEPYLHRGSYWEYFSDANPILDNGPLWFVGVLLVYSLALAGWRRLRPPAPAPEAADRPLGLRDLALLSLAVGLATFLVRIGFPANSNQPLNIHLWAWPEYVAMFTLGVMAARRQWLRPVPRAIYRPAGIATLVVVAALAAVILSTEPLGLTEDAWFGGWGLPALLSGLLEGVIAVAAPVWVLSFAQRRLNGSGPLRRAMARSSYAAFMLQGPVLVACALVLRRAPLPGDAKAFIVAALGIAGSFALAWPLVTRTPVGRVL